MDEVRLEISGVVEKDNKRIAHIRFTRGSDYAEGYIPDCVITKAQGFSDEEKEQLEDYLKNNLTQLKKKAALLNPLNGFMGKNV